MQYVLMFNQPLAVIERDQDPVKGATRLAPWMAYMEAMGAAGVMRGGNRLGGPWTATTVRKRDGKRQVQDGPFAETKEHAAGYVVIEVGSLDEALAWAERAPSTVEGSTTVWPVIPGPS